MEVDLRHYDNVGNLDKFGSPRQESGWGNIESIIIVVLLRRFGPSSEYYVNRPQQLSSPDMTIPPTTAQIKANATDSSTIGTVSTVIATTSAPIEVTATNPSTTIGVQSTILTTTSAPPTEGAATNPSTAAAESTILTTTSAPPTEAAAIIPSTVAVAETTVIASTSAPIEAAPTNPSTAAVAETTVILTTNAPTEAAATDLPATTPSNAPATTVAP